MIWRTIVSLSSLNELELWMVRLCLYLRTLRLECRLNYWELMRNSPLDILLLSRRHLEFLTGIKGSWSGRRRGCDLVRLLLLLVVSVMSDLHWWLDIALVLLLLNVLVLWYLLGMHLDQWGLLRRDLFILLGHIPLRELRLYIYCIYS